MGRKKGCGRNLFLNKYGPGEATVKMFPYKVR